MMTRMRSRSGRLASAFTCAAVLLCLAPAARPSAQTPPPKLVVVLVVDQMRADYIEWYGPRERRVIVQIR